MNLFRILEVIAYYYILIKVLYGLIKITRLLLKQKISLVKI